MPIPTIVIANGTMNAGGTETLIMELLRHQTGRVRYILMAHYQGKIQEGVFDEEIRSLGVPIVHIPSVGMLGIKGYCKKFKGLLEDLGPVDIIHSHLNANGGIICMAAKQAGIKYRISHCHAEIKYSGGILSNAKEELVLQVLRMFVNHFSNHYWACSHSAWKRLFYPWKKEIVIPNMIDVRKYLSTPKEKEKAKAAIGLSGKFIVGSIGRVSRIKNYELAIKTIAALNKKGKETQFVCYGRLNAEEDSYFAELLNLAEELGVIDKVHFMGNTARVAQAIKSFDVFIMPSTSEGFGMAAIEAQAAGIPTLLSEGVPRIVDVNIGLVQFLPLTNVSAWVEMILNVNNDIIVNEDDIICRFQEKGYDSVTGVKRIEDLYLQIIK